jgi:hypothetical protein
MTPQQFKLLKVGAKLVLGLGFSILLGVTYKVGKQSEDELDEYLEKKYSPKDVENV